MTHTEDCEERDKPHEWYEVKDRNDLGYPNPLYYRCSECGKEVSNISTHEYMHIRK